MKFALCFTLVWTGAFTGLTLAMPQAPEAGWITLARDVGIPAAFMLGLIVVLSRALARIVPEAISWMARQSKATEDNTDEIRRMRETLERILDNEREETRDRRERDRRKRRGDAPEAE